MFSLREEHMLMICVCMCAAVSINLDIFLFGAFIEHTEIKLLDKDVAFYIPSSLSLFSPSSFSHPPLICQGVVGREPFPLPAVPGPACIDTESYYEEAQPYEETFNGKKTCFTWTQLWIFTQQGPAEGLLGSVLDY